MNQIMSGGKRSFKIITGKRWLLCCLLFFVAACKNRSAEYKQYTITAQDSIAQVQLASRAFIQLDSVSHIIHTGDLVTRTGNDFTSETFRQFNQHDKTFSHCGIAIIENDTVFIYHALGGEFNPDQKIRRDPLKLFGEPYSNRGIGIFRHKLSAFENDQLISTIKNWYNAGIMFDMKFDLATNARMYCAEFVYKAFLSATKRRLHFKTSHIEDFEFIGVDDLYMQPSCIPLKRILYK